MGNVNISGGSASSPMTLIKYSDEKILTDNIHSRCNIIGRELLSVKKILMKNTINKVICRKQHCCSLDHEDDTVHIYLFETTNDLYGYAEYYETECFQHGDNNGTCILNSDKTVIMNVYHEKNNNVVFFNVASSAIDIKPNVSDSESNDKELGAQTLSTWNDEIKRSCVIMNLNNVEYEKVDKIIEWKRIKEACQHCGYGIHAEILFEQSNGTFGYADYWLGCLTYDPRGSVVIAKDLDKLKEIIKL